MTLRVIAGQMTMSRPWNFPDLFKSLGVIAVFGLGFGNPLVSAPIAGSLVVGGVERHYLVVTPSTFDRSLSLPVVFVFHGKGNDGAAMEKESEFSELANRKHFIAVFPDGLNHEWNGGRKPPVSRQSEKSDDVDFISMLIDKLATHYKIDPKRVYATGSSNGAMFCYTLAARLSARIAAIGPVSGILGVPIRNHFRPTSPVSVISFNGTDDQLVPFAGIEPSAGDGLLSVPDTIAFWVGIDGCTPEPIVTKDEPSPLDEGTNIVRFYYGKKATDSEVLAFVIEHGGHTWPGKHTDPEWAKIAGKTAVSINATELMWDFFSTHAKP